MLVSQQIRGSPTYSKILRRQSKKRLHRRRRRRLADGTMPDGSSLPSRFRPLVPHLRLGPVRHKNTDRSECGRHVIFRILLRFQIWVCYFMIFVVFFGSGLVLPLSCGGWRWRFGIRCGGCLSEFWIGEVFCGSHHRARLHPSKNDFFYETKSSGERKGLR